MKYIEEFRNKEICQKLSEELYNISNDRDITLMEVCGTHTMAIFRYGLKSLLPPNIRLLSGPGCPVCVTPNSHIDKAIAYCKKDDTIVATFGDMIRVPGSSSSLLREKSFGRDVRVVYTVSDAIKIADEHPDKKVIFLGIGFETTSPTIAASIQDAARKDLRNYFVLSMHKLIPPAMKIIMESEELNIDGFILPGHVATITGTKVYEFIPRDYSIPCCVAGFEPLDILQAILTLIQQIMEGKSSVENKYKRVVKREGNLKALSLLNEIFEQYDSEWRGIGFIPKSGLRIKKKYMRFDAEKNISVEIEPVKENPNCICGEVLLGIKTPLDCSLFGNVCNPENPIGSCMVSSEGTCAAYYKYER